MDKYIIYWIWLQSCLGTDSKRLAPAINAFVTPENIFRADENELRNTGIFSEKELSRLLKKDLAYSVETAENCDKQGIDVICYKNSEYPSRLASIATPPVVLYVKGRLPQQSLPQVGIVGTRNPDETGKKLAYSFGFDAADNSAVVISGGAYGVDIFAHKGAVCSGGSTVCVLGCGIDMFESRVSRYLLDEVPEKGAVISEYPPKYPPTRYTFPARNRIISGMSDSVAVIQAGLGSGALITVRFAVAQNRKVFSVPGNMDNIFSSGNNYLLRCGFSAALCANDVLSWISHRNLDPDNLFVNPAVNARQLSIISTKPEELIVKRNSDTEMPLAVCCEIARSISLEEDSAGCMTPEPVQETFYDRTEETSASSGEKAESDLQSEDAADKIAEGIDDDTERLLYEESIPGMRNPTYIMDKKTMLSLFTSTRDFNELAQDIKKNNGESEYPVRRKSISRKETENKANNKKENKTEVGQITSKKRKMPSENIKNNESENKILPKQLTAAAVTVYDTILDTPVYTDAVVEASGLSAGEVLSSLTELELYGLIVRLPGNKFIRKE